MIERIQDIQGFLRLILKTRIRPGDTALDLTAGWGRDTLFLAEAVGPAGRVHAFDIQSVAIAESRRLLEEHGVAGRVIFHEADHALVRNVVTEPVHVAMFNLGYLPGTDRLITTQAESTVPAVQGVLSLLAEQGLLALTVYRGHPGGAEEAQAIEKFLANLPRKAYSVLSGKYINQGEQTPYWILVQKNKGEIG